MALQATTRPRTAPEPLSTAAPKRGTPAPSPLSPRGRSCTRRREAEAARRQRYCICHGGWDGKAFMIACDTCGVWYHGACVGFSPQSVFESTQV